MKYVAKHYTLNQSEGQRPVPREKMTLLEVTNSLRQRLLSLCSRSSYTFLQSFSGLRALTERKTHFSRGPTKSQEASDLKNGEAKQWKLPLGRKSTRSTAYSRRSLTHLRCVVAFRRV
jgi:hypothetical protein